MLADLQILIFCNVYHQQCGRDFHCSCFVHIFNNRFSIGLTLWAERYKIPATNIYYLNQIDSVRYSTILSRLKGKYENNFSISDSGGQVVFYLKTYVQKKCNDYDNTYQHQLVTENYPNPAINCKTCPDTTLFIDSAVNKNWRYVFEKYNSGH